MKLSDYINKSSNPNAGNNGVSSFYREFIIVTNTMILNKEIELSYIPTLNSVRLSIIGGTEQREGIDFLVVDNIITWHFLALDLLLEVGTILSIDYIRSA
jgi:hypothetical protein